MKNIQLFSMVNVGPTVVNVVPSELYEKVAVCGSPGAMSAESLSH
jgi:hypothetical protein